MFSPAQYKEYLSLESLVLEPGGILDDGGVGGEQESQNSVFGDTQKKVGHGF